MLLPLFQAVIFAVLTGYLLWTCRYMHWRNQQGWDELTAQILPVDKVDEAEPAKGLAGLRITFQNARVLMEMADFAERNGPLALAPADLQPIHELRRNAMQTRLDAVRSLPRCIFSA
jgi:hypothetical protein